MKTSSRAPPTPSHIGKLVFQQATRKRDPSYCENLLRDTIKLAFAKKPGN